MLVNFRFFMFFLFVAIGLLASCASQERIGGLRLIDVHGNVCVFEEGATVYRRAYVGEACRETALDKAGAIVIENDVDLSARDLTVVLDYLRLFAENQCMRNEGKEFLQCLNGALPNYVTRRKKCFVFWYGRNLGDGSSGFPVGVVRNENGFSAPDSSCE